MVGSDSVQRFSRDVIKFIKTSDRSYSKILEELHQKFGIITHKSVISYYKGNRPRIIPIYTERLKAWELDWLFGLYFADGSKFIERKYSYIIKINLDKKRDLDIAERLVLLILKIGCNPTISFDKNVLVIRVISKLLYGIFPTKDDDYRPKDVLAFASGMIDGDGAVNTHGAAVIVQTYFGNLMLYLSKNLGLTRCEQKEPRSPIGLRISYYVPKSVCEVIKSRGYCVKLLRKINKTNN